MPFVKIEMYKGRDRARKAALAKAITEAFVTHAGSRAEDVQIVFHDVERGDWAVAGELADKDKPS